MKRYIFILLVFLSFGSFAQQGLQMNFGEVDSAEVEYQRQIEYYQFINGNFSPDGLISELKLPDYKFNTSFGSPYSLNMTFQPFFHNNFTSISNFDIISPFFYNAEILSSDAYQIGNKLVLGGFSYGANSVMSAPSPNQMGQSFDNYGSTMFMQYKVSKNFKIETRVSVGQNRGPIPPGF